MFLLLLAFWVLLNGRITAEILILGVLICGAVYAVSCKVLGYDPKQELRYAKKIPGALRYLVILVWEVIKAGLQVMALTLSPDAKEVEPRLVYFKSPVETDTGKVILSNSITLTPGTITVAMSDNELVVHCLDKGLAIGLENSSFERLLLKIEKEEG